MWVRIDDSPIRALSTGMIINEIDGAMAVVIQVDHVQVVITDPNSAREFAEGILALLPVIESGVLPEPLRGEGVSVGEDSMKAMERSVAKNREVLGLGPQQYD